MATVVTGKPVVQAKTLGKEGENYAAEKAAEAGAAFLANASIENAL